MMDGRVKTLHPKIHGGLLCLRSNDSHLSAALEHGITMIDLVVVNLYPFEETVSRTGTSFAEAIEQIDIGGPSMLRSAAKNHQDVTVVCDHADYDEVLQSLDGSNDSSSFRRYLAQKVFARTSAYDQAISEYLHRETEEVPDLDSISGLPSNLKISSPKAMGLGMVRTLISRLYSMANFLIIFINCRARSFHITTDSISLQPPILLENLKNPQWLSLSIPTHVE